MEVTVSATGLVIAAAVPASAVVVVAVVVSFALAEHAIMAASCSQTYPGDSVVKHAGVTVLGDVYEHCF